MRHIYKASVWLCLVFAVLLAFVFSSVVVKSTEEFRVTQGEFSRVITPLAKSESAANFYDYRDFEAHTNPDIELSRQSILFVYKNTNTDTLSLVVIHHDGEGSDSGSFLPMKADFSFSGIPSSATVAVKDDVDDDSYPINGSISWGWDYNRTDGVVIGDIGNNFTITISANFNSKITDWKIVSGDINNPTYIKIPSMTEPIEISTETETDGLTHEVNAETYNLLSIPVSPDPADKDSVIGDDLPEGSYTWGQWNGDDYSELTTMSPFEGFWLYTPSETTIDVSGDTPENMTYELTRTGWFMISSPVEVAWGDVKIKDNGGSYSSIKNIDCTNSESPIFSSIWSYDPSAGEYRVHQQPGWDTYVLDPWKGYWLYVNPGTSTPVSLKYGETGEYPLPPSPPDSPDSSLVERGILLSNMSENVPNPPPPPSIASTANPIEVIAYSNFDSNISEVTFALKGEGTYEVERIKVQVDSLDGETLFSSATSDSSLTWNTDAVPNGVYLYTASVKVNGVFVKANIGKLLILY